MVPILVYFGLPVLETAVLFLLQTFYVEEGSNSTLYIKDSFQFKVNFLCFGLNYRMAYISWIVTGYLAEVRKEKMYDHVPVFC